MCSGTIAYVFTGTKYHTQLMDNAYKTHMKLTIMSVTMSDYGVYQCISKNSLGDTDGTIKLYGTFTQIIVLRLISTFLRLHVIFSVDFYTFKFWYESYIIVGKLLWKNVFRVFQMYSNYIVSNIKKKEIFYVRILKRKRNLVTISIAKSQNSS